MEPMKLKAKRLFSLPKKTSTDDNSSGRVGINIEEWEIRPGGMLVQKRDSDPNQAPVSIPTIKVRVKYQSVYHEISISSQASFGELKKKATEYTGLHHEDQKMIYKKKEKNSKEYLDIVGVKNGSKIVLIEDIARREKRCLEMLKNANTEKASKTLSQITLEVDKFADQVKCIERSASDGEKVAEAELDNLTEMLLSKLVILDGIVVGGDLNLQKRTQERRVQQQIETLDKLKLDNSKVKNSHRGIRIAVQKQEHGYSREKLPVPTMEKQLPERNFTGKRPILQQQKQPLMHSESFVVTTKWETFE